MATFYQTFKFKDKETLNLAVVSLRKEAGVDFDSYGSIDSEKLILYFYNKYGWDTTLLPAVKKVASSFIYEKSTDYSDATLLLTVTDGREEWKTEYYLDSYD